MSSLIVGLMMDQVELSWAELGWKESQPASSNKLVRMRCV
jgi:hypothetical protein